MPTYSAADVLGRYLIAKEDVPVYDLPNGTRIGEIKKGNSTAEVYSYVVRNGEVWWVFDYTIPGQTPGAYYVLQKDGRFSLSSIPGNALVSPSILPEVDVFPGANKLMIYGLLGLVAVLLIRK